MECINPFNPLPLKIIKLISRPVSILFFVVIFFLPFLPTVFRDQGSNLHTSHSWVKRKRVKPLHLIFIWVIISYFRFFKGLLHSYHMADFPLWSRWSQSWVLTGCQSKQDGNIVHASHCLLWSYRKKSLYMPEYILNNLMLIIINRWPHSLSQDCIFLVHKDN